LYLLFHDPVKTARATAAFGKSLSMACVARGVAYPANGHARAQLGTRRPERFAFIDRTDERRLAGGVPGRKAVAIGAAAGRPAAVRRTPKVRTAHAASAGRRRDKLTYDWTAFLTRERHFRFPTMAPSSSGMNE
jgi:hypothetical protein